MAKTPSILAIDANISHDASVTVVRDGELFAVECERLDRVKKSGGYRVSVERTDAGLTYHLTDHGDLTYAIRYCLDLAGLRQVDHVIHTGHPRYVRFLELERYMAPGARIQSFPSHHLAHACSSFYYSDFPRAAVLVVDGSGPERGTTAALLQSSYFFDGTSIKALRRTATTGQHQLGIGLNYFVHTLLLRHEEGSIMGLSSYGDAARFPQSMLVESEGNIYVDPTRLANPVSTHCGEATERTLLGHYGLSLEEVREARAHIESSVLADVAARLQQETEQRMVQLANELYEATGCDALCMAGGVTLNSVANHKILEQTPFREIFIQPAAHDAGISLGLALFAHHHLHGAERRPRRNAYLGKAYTDAEIETTLARYANHVTWERVPAAAPAAAQLLASGEVIGWFQGRMEFGPRALGHRSILAHPGSLAIRDRVNDIKKRERWRPLAPSVLASALPEFFEMRCHNAYMLLVAQVTERARREAPAIVHVDGTARPQAVEPDASPLLHELITAFAALTGLPLVLNTSLNTKGEPLIEHPEQAIIFLLNSGVDALVIGSFVVRRAVSAARPPTITVRPAEDPGPPIDLLRCRAQVASELRGIGLRDLAYFKGDYHVFLEVVSGSERHPLDLGFKVVGGRVASLVNLRLGKEFADRYRPLVEPFITAFERYLAESAGQP